MGNERTKGLLCFFLVMVMLCGLMQTTTVSANIKATRVSDGAQNVIDSLSESQLRAYETLNMAPRPAGLVGFDDEVLQGLENSNESVLVIVEFVHQPPIVAQVEAAIEKGLFMSINETSILAEKDHADFKENLNNLFGLQSNGRSIAPSSAYKIMSEYRVALNGVALSLPANMLDEVLNFNSVRAIYPNELIDYSPIEYAPTSASDILGMTEERNYLNIEALHNAGITGQGITVCVIDTGVDYNHPDLKDAFGSKSPTGDNSDLLNGKFYGRNFVKYEESDATMYLGLTNNPANDPMEMTYQDYLTAYEKDDTIAWGNFVSEHGTHVSGTIAARGTNYTEDGISAKGVAPGCTLYVYRALSYRGGLMSWIVDAVEMVAKDKPDVVNMSLGTSGAALSALSTQAVSRIMLGNPKITFVLAAGNDGEFGSYSMGSPASSPLAITVGNGSVTHNDVKLTAEIPGEAGFYTMDGLYGSAGTKFSLNGYGTYTSNYVDLYGKDINGQYEVVVLPVDGNKVTGTVNAGNIGTGTAKQFADYCDKNGAYSLEGKFVMVSRGASFFDTIKIAKQYKVGALIVINNDSSYTDIAWYRGSMSSVPMYVMTKSGGFAFATAVSSGSGKFKITDKDDAPEELHYSSSRGPVRENYDIKPDVVAPGVNILSTVPYYMATGPDGAPVYKSPGADGAYNTSYKYMLGTSMASPHVAGVAALMYQYSNKTWTAQEIKTRLMNTANPMSPNIADGGYSVHDVGAGYINPQRAIYANVNVTALNNVFINDEYTELEGGETSSLNKVSNYVDYEMGLFNFGEYRVPENPSLGSNFSKTIKATVNNSAGVPKEFRVEYKFNTTGPLINDNVAGSGAGLTLPGTVTAPAYGKTTFDVTMNIPRTVAVRGSFEGYITLTNTADSFEVYRLPFAAFVKDDINVLTNAFLNQPVIAEKGTEQVTGISGSASLYFSLSDVPSYLYYGLIEGGATKSEWEDQLNWMGEFGYSIVDTGLALGEIYYYSDVIRNSYDSYVKSQTGAISIGERGKKLAPGHYKLVLVVVSMFQEEYHAIDFYVDGTAPVLAIDNTVETESLTMITFTGNAPKITGTLKNTMVPEYKKAGIRYDIYEEADILPNVPDQSYNAIFAKIGDEYIRGRITNSETGAFEIDITDVDASAEFLDIKLYAIKNFSINQFNISMDIKNPDDMPVVLDVFDPDNASLGYYSEDLATAYAWYGTNMFIKDITLIKDSLKIVLDKNYVRMAVGATAILKSFLTPSMVAAGYTTPSYSSNDLKIVTVDGAGKLTAINPGIALITVTSSKAGAADITATCEVNVGFDVSAGVNLEKGSYVYFGNYRHVTAAQSYSELSSKDGVYKYTVNTPGSHFKSTSREAERTPVLWQVMGEEVIGDNAQTDERITLLSKYVLDVYDYLPTWGNYYQASWMIWPNYYSNLQVFLNGGEYTDYYYDPVTGDPLSGGQPDTSVLYFNGLDDKKEREDQGRYFKNSFTDAEYDAIPFYDVWVGRYNNGALDKRDPDNGFDYGVLSNQKFYIPISTYSSEEDTGSGAKLSWAAGGSNEVMYDSNVLGQSKSDNVATLKGGNMPIAYRDRATAIAVGSDLAKLRLTGITVMADGSTQVANGLTAKTGVRPVTKLIPEFIVYAKEVTATGKDGTLKADGINYIEPQDGSKYYKLTVLGGNNGESVGRLSGVPVSHSEPVTVASNVKLSVENVTAAAAESSPDYSDYSIAYKIVNGQDEAVRYGEFNATGGSQNLELDVMSLDGRHKVYIWLQKNSVSTSDTAGIVYVFDINVNLVNTDTTLRSSVGVVDGAPNSRTITVPFNTTVKALKDSITVAANAVYKIFNGATEVTSDTAILADGWIVRVTAGGVSEDYTIRLDAPLRDAFILAASIGTFTNPVGSANGKIEKVPAATTVSDLISALTLPLDATVKIYKEGSIEAGNSEVIQSGWILVVTAQDVSVTATYEIYTASSDTALILNAEGLAQLKSLDTTFNASIRLSQVQGQPHKVSITSELYDSFLPVMYVDFIVKKPEGAAWKFYLNSGEEVDPTGNTLLKHVNVVVTAADGKTTATYIFTKASSETTLAFNHEVAANPDNGINFTGTVNIVHPAGGDGNGTITGIPSGKIPAEEQYFSMLFSIPEGASAVVLDEQGETPQGTPHPQYPIIIIPPTYEVGYTITVTSEDGTKTAVYTVSGASNNTTPTQGDGAGDLSATVTVEPPADNGAVGKIRIVSTNPMYYQFMTNDYLTMLIKMPAGGSHEVLDNGVGEPTISFNLHGVLIEITAEDGVTKAKYRIILGEGDYEEPQPEIDLTVTSNDPLYVVNQDESEIYVPHATGALMFNRAIIVSSGATATIYKSFDMIEGTGVAHSGAMSDNFYYLVVTPKTDTSEPGPGPGDGPIIGVSSARGEAAAVQRKVYKIIVEKDSNAFLEKSSTGAGLSIIHIGDTGVAENLTGVVSNITEGTTVGAFKAMVTAKPSGSTLLPVRVYSGAEQTEKRDSELIQTGDIVRVSSQLQDTAVFAPAFYRYYTVYTALPGIAVYLVSPMWKIDNTGKTISGVPFGISLDDFKANLLTYPTDASYTVYSVYIGAGNSGNATASSGMVQSGYKVVAEPKGGGNPVVYTVTVNAAETANTLISSDKGLVSEINKAITNVPFGTSIEIFKRGIKISALATFEIYNADGMTVATDLSNGCLLIITAQSGAKNTYTISLTPGGGASLTSSLWTVANIGDSDGSITNVPYNISLNDFVMALVPSTGASMKVHLGDGTPVTAPDAVIRTGYKVIVTAQDGITKRVYTVTTIDAAIIIRVAVGTGGRVEGAGAYSPGAIVRLTAAPDTGYVFDGWYESGLRISTDRMITFNAVENRNIEAKFTKVYEVRLNVFPSDYTATIIGAGVYNEGEQVTAEVDNSSGRFRGWYEDGVRVSANPVYVFNISADRVLEARFATVSITVGVKDANGSVTGGGYYCLGEEVVINAVPNPGLVFKSWHTNIDFDSQISDAAQTYVFTANSDMDFYAEFEAAQADAVTVTVNQSLGGTITGGGLIKLNGTVVLVATPAEGYEFVRWIDEQNATPPASRTYSFTATVNTTISAEWIKLHTVTFVTNGGSPIENITVRDESQIDSVPVTSKTGHTFDGWYTDAEFSAAFNESAPINADTVLYAKWIQNVYTVGFETNGGGIVDTQSVVHGTNAVKPADPIKANYHFSGWYETPEFSRLYDFNKPVTANVTLYAKWVQVTNVYTITFNSNGGSAVAAQAVAHEGYAARPATAKDGYRFDGWYTDQALTTLYNFNAPVTSSFMLYAKWTVTHTVTFISNGGSYVAPQIIVHGDRIQMIHPYLEGYSFNGWFIDSGLTVMFDNAPVTQNLVLYASWTKITMDYEPEWTPGPIQPPVTTPAPSPSPSNGMITIPVAYNKNVKGIIKKDESDLLTSSAILEQRDSNSGEINLNIGDNESIILNASALDSIVETGNSLSVTNSAATVIIPLEMLKKLSIDSNDGTSESKQAATIEIKISPVQNVYVPSRIIKDNPVNEKLLSLVVDVTIVVNGVEVKTFSEPLILKFDVSGMNLTKEQIAKLTGVRLLPDGNYDQVGGEMVDGFFVTQTSSLSKYSVIVSETLVKVVTTIGNKTYTVNGKAYVSDVEPFISGSRTMVPYRFIAEAFGAEVIWDDSSKKVTVRLGGKTFTLTVGLLEDGMDVAPFIHEGRTMVPLRYVSEKLGANVIWNSRTRKVTMYK